MCRVTGRLSPGSPVRVQHQRPGGRFLTSEASFHCAEPSITEGGKRGIRDKSRKGTVEFQTLNNI